MNRFKMKFLSVAAAGLLPLAAGGLVPMPFGPFVSQAHAVVGRPVTPGSVAGVARRTTRRVIRRSSIYAATLPAGCTSISVNGAAVWRCGGVYYQAYGGRYVVVYID